MAARIVPKDDQYVLNHCTKFLARDSTDRRHDFGHLAPDDQRADICEPWRFPVVDSHRGEGEDRETAYRLNDVTFVFRPDQGQAPEDVAVVGTFAGLYEPVALRRLAVTDRAAAYHTVTVVVPKGEMHLYKFLVDGQALIDPVNPQRVTLDNGREWSRFFTHQCTLPLTLEHADRILLDRLTDHILPFRTEDGRNFLARYHDRLDDQAKQAQLPHAYRLDESVGVVNYIDKLLAKEERHHLVDYKVCLALIDRLLRQRSPSVEPARMSREMFVHLYDEMAAGNVPGWDYGRYQNPRYFLQLLRRHTFTGAFSHPKYGGNAAAAGWSYLEERYQDEGRTMFNWRKAIEAPLGGNTDYWG